MTIPWRNYFRTLAWFLLVALLFKGVLLFRIYALQIHHNWNETGKGYAIFLGLIASSAMLFRLFRPESKAPSTKGQSTWCILALACGVLFMVFYLHDIVYNPLILCGEWAHSTWSAANIWERLSRGVFIPPPAYNIGIGYFYLPLYALVGHSIWAAKALYLVCWILSLCILTVVWKRWYGNEGMLSMLAVVSTLAYGLAVQRNYKWHVIAVLLVATLFWIVSRLERRPRFIEYLYLIGVLVVGTVCYHNCIVYTIFISVYLLARFKCGSGAKRNIWIGVAGIWFLILSCITAAYLWKHYGWFDRGAIRIIKQWYSGGKILYPPLFPATYLYLFFKETGSIASLTLILGLGAAIVDCRKEWIAKFALIGFLMISVALMLTFPFSDTSQGNNIIIFVFLVMAYGIYSFLTRIPWTIVRQIAVVSLLWALTLQEYPCYEAYYWNDGCHPFPGAVALYDLKMSRIYPEDVIFFPGLDVKAAEGGIFSYELYSNGFRKREYASLSRSIRCFRSLEGLRLGVDALMEQPTFERGTIKAYLSTAVDREKLSEALDGLNYLCYEVSYFEREWHGKVSVYKLVILGEATDS